MQHIARRIIELLGRELIGAPIGGLLLLGELDAEQLLGKVLEAVPVGEGAGKARGDLGAVDRPRHYAEAVLEHGHVKAGEMEDLEHPLIGKEPLQLWRLVMPAELNEFGIAVAA